MILNTFSLMDAKRILCILLAIEAHKNMLVWGEEAHKVLLREMLRGKS
ncbi:hypothetical protein Gotur_032416 [Gossypium turneri]